jgi:ADP-ribose pyrophosphatase
MQWASPYWKYRPEASTPGEEPADCVRLELQEEIGCLPGKIERPGGFYAIPGYGTEYLHCYLATELVPSLLVAEDTDEIEVVKVPLNQVPQLITSGKICDAKSIASLVTFLFVTSH